MNRTGLLRRFWMKLFVNIERTVYRDDHRRLTRAYWIEDPWNLGSTREQCRYREMNSFISRHCGPIGTILEIGSGEGHHTRYLLELTGEIVGIEVSPKAIARARRRCPSVGFVQAAFPPVPSGLKPKFDLVVASEVLYYIRDLETALAAMGDRGRFCVASCYGHESERLDTYLLTMPMVTWEDIACEGLRYRLYLWQPPLSSSPHA